MYWWLYKDYDNERGICYNWDKMNLKYCLDAKEAEQWYNDNKNLMVTVNIKRPPNLEIPIQIPLGTDLNRKKDIDKNFLTFITKGAISTRMELVLSRFMDNYHLDKNWVFHRREQEDKSALESTRNVLALCMMKDIILWVFRVTPIKIPAWKDKKNLGKTEYINWDIGEDFSIEYEVQGEKYKTNLFWVYKPKLFEAMLADTWRQFNGFCLQNWQMMVWLLSWWVTYVIWPRWWGKCKMETEKIRLSDWTFKLAKDVKVWDKLLASDKKGYTNVVDVQHFQKECVRVILKDGTDFIVTKDHRIPTQNTYHNWSWDMDIGNYTTAENLVPGKDFVPLMIDNKEFRKAESLDFEKWVLVWMLLWDWSLTGSTVEITCIDTDKREYICSILNKLWYEYYLKKDEKNIGIKWFNNIRREYWLFWKSHEKEISNKIFSESNKFKRWVISWMLWTDWYLWIKKHTKKINMPFVEYSSVNKKLVRQLRVLMADVWLISYERKKNKDTHFKDWKKYNTDFYYAYISDRDSLNKINKYCNLSLKQNYMTWSMLVKDEVDFSQWTISIIPKCAFKEKTVKGIRINWHNYYNWIREPYYDFQRSKCKKYWIEQWLKYNWSKVEKVEDVWLQNVVNIEVDWDHTYWGELDLTHNSLYINGDSAWYLLKEITDSNERIQEFSVLYMGLSQKQNAPYMVYSQQMLNNLIDLPSFCNKLPDSTWLYIVDWDKQRKLEYVTTNQNDPTRSRRTRKFVWDEADYLDWDYVWTAMATADSLVTLISTIGPNTQAWHFYQGWLNAYKNQRDYEPIDVLIHDIWTKYWMHLCKSRKDYLRKIKSWDFEKMRAEFIQRRPEVALHFTMDDVEFLTEEQKQAQVTRVLNARWYDYMLAEYYWEYSTDQTVFNIEWVQLACPTSCDYWVVGYDEADTFDNPWLCILWVKDWKYYIKETYNLAKESNERFSKMKQVIQDLKNSTRPVYLVLDASRGWAAARELWMLGMPVDMLIKWTGNVTYQPWARHNVGKAWCIEMIKSSFFDTNIIHIDPACYWENWLVEELSHFKKWKASARWEKKKHDDQVSWMMLVLYFAWFHDQIWIKDVARLWSQKTEQQMIEWLWAEKYQKPQETTWWFLSNLKTNLF